MNAVVTLTNDEVASLISSVSRTIDQTVKIVFVYASGHTYHANNVLLVDFDDSVIQYVNFKGNNTDAVTISANAISKFDLVHALVIDEHEGTTTIIHGLADSFEVTPTAKLQKILVSNAHDDALAEERHRKWKQNEADKYQKRKLQRAKATGKFGTEKIKRTKKSK